MCSTGLVHPPSLKPGPESFQREGTLCLRTSPYMPLRGRSALLLRKTSSSTKFILPQWMSLPPFKNKRRHPDKATFAERPSLKFKCLPQNVTKMIFKSYTIYMALYCWAIESNFSTFTNPKAPPNLAGKQWTRLKGHTKACREGVDLARSKAQELTPTLFSLLPCPGLPSPPLS